MAQGTAAHFANRAPLRGIRSRNHFRLGEWKIGTLLAASFAAIVLLMIVGSAIAVFNSTGSRHGPGVFTRRIKSHSLSCMFTWML